MVVRPPKEGRKINNQKEKKLFGLSMMLVLWEILAHHEL